MESFIAFCENNNCGAIFEVPSFVRGNVTIGFGEGINVVSSCPICKSEAKIPNGIYEFANEALTKFTGSKISVETLQKVQEILKQSELTKSSKQEILKDIDAVSPETAEILKKSPSTSNLSQWVIALTAVITLAIYAHSTYIKEDKVEAKFIEHLLQENKELRKKNKAKPIKKEKSKIQRNTPCPCNSGKKYKKCCGLIQT